MSRSEIVYLDNSATTMVCPEAAQKVMEVMTAQFGNPSSRHALGIEAEEIVDEARRSVAQAIGCAENEVIFTSGGTESNNLAVLGAARALKRRGRRVVTTQIEHSSVLEAAAQLEREGFEVIRLKPDQSGRIREEDIFGAVNADTVLVSMMLVNNETGAIQPVEAAKRAVARAGCPALVHCDAVQAFCKLPVSPRRLGADLLSVSAHKIHGPKGAGALYLRNGARILPLMHGGGQEKGLRPGTEAAELIAGFGVAASLAAGSRQRDEKRIQGLKDRLLTLLEDIPGIAVNSPPSGAIANLLNISVPGIRSEVMLNFLSNEQIYLSSGSACSRGKKSRVLQAMGLDDARVDSALRISFSRFSTVQDVETLADAIRRADSALQKTKAAAFHG